MKKIIKLLLMITIIGIFSSITVYGAVNYYAHEISYNGKTVGYALDELYGKSENIKTSKYSYDEIVVGEWVNGELLYRKVIYSSLNITAGNNIIANLENVDTVVQISGTLHVRDTYYGSIPYADRSLNMMYSYENGNIMLYSNAKLSSANLIVIVEYTKKIDDTE